MGDSTALITVFDRVSSLERLFENLEDRVSDLNERLSGYDVHISFQQDKVRHLIMELDIIKRWMYDSSDGEE